MNALLGHTPDGQPVTVWDQANAWTGRLETFLEIGRELIELDHVEPGLLEALTASLKEAA